MASIYKHKRGWRVQVRRDGRNISKLFESKKAAQRWAFEIESRIEAHGIPTSEADRTTLRDALERYRREITPTKRGAAQENIRIGQWMLDPLAQRSLASIRSTDIAEWRDRQIEEGKAPSTIRNHVTIISQIYRTAIHEWGLFGLQNPVTNVRMPKSRPGRDRRLAQGEYERLLAAAKADANPWIEHAIVLAIETGMRAGELISMEWKQVNLASRIVTLPESKTKNGRRRSVPLSKKAVQVLQTMPRSLDGMVLPIIKPTLDKAWRRCLKECEISDLHWHDLRHEFTSRMFERGLDIAQVMSITGHTTMTMVSRYTHLQVRDLADLLD
jgi:integrase